jgi:hypothetical protein
MNKGARVELRGTHTVHGKEMDNVARIESGRT